MRHPPIIWGVLDFLLLELPFNLFFDMKNFGFNVLFSFTDLSHEKPLKFRGLSNTMRRFDGRMPEMWSRGDRSASNPN